MVGLLVRVWFGFECVSGLFSVSLAFLLFGVLCLVCYCGLL